MPAVELERRPHLLDGLEVATDVQELPCRREATLQQRLADAAATQVPPQVHALQFAGERIRARERRYAGTAGWVDAAGNGAWAVSVRCAEIDGSTARVWAGNGIVTDSDPVTELAETRIKFQAMLSALVRP